MRHRFIAGLCFVLGIMLPGGAAAEDAYQKAQNLFQAGNYAEAHRVFTNVLFTAGHPTAEQEKAVSQSVQCLQRLNRTSELDALLERAASEHADNWQLLGHIAGQYNQIGHYGYIVAGSFERGHHRGGGKVVQAQDRDRVKALRLLQRANSHEIKLEIEDR